MNFIRYNVLRYRFSSNIYRAFRKKQTQLSIIESERRKNVDIFDFMTLAKPMKKNSYFHAGENNLYGTGKLLRYFEELNEKNSVVEHGFIFGSFVHSFKVKSWTGCLVTFSDYRKKFLEEKTNKKVFCVGPYIHYFPSILNKKEITSFKKQLGRVLLVFPSHSLGDINLKYNKKEFRDSIVKLSQEFDTVLICLYWADIQKETYKDYSNDKFKIVTAGHIYDMYFLNRLRSIIELSDFVFSNSVGTHIGYSIYLNKPIYLQRQDIKIELIDPKSTQLSQRNKSDFDSMNSTINDIFELFDNKENRQITKEQFTYISELFGFKYLKKLD